ncbi:MAG: hypothetical protein K1X67_10525 [Fimbriimonadaceae bacterium]|nr:hypothetical protein [Fimbriimonadaceae bacterium]
MPLAVGSKWTYSVRAGFLSRVEDLKVLRTISVADVEGYELTGPMGNSRVAWKGGNFLVEDLPGTRLSPALPILIGESDKASRRWSGIAKTLSGAKEATADIVQAKDTVTIGGQTYETRRSEVVLRGLGSPITLTTWFHEGIGMLRQEQRVGDQLVRSMEYLAGP